MGKRIFLTIVCCGAALQASIAFAGSEKRQSELEQQTSISDGYSELRHFEPSAEAIVVSPQRAPAGEAGGTAAETEGSHFRIQQRRSDGSTVWFMQPLPDSNRKVITKSMSFPEPMSATDGNAPSPGK